MALIGDTGSSNSGGVLLYDSTGILKVNITGHTTDNYITGGGGLVVGSSNANSNMFRVVGGTTQLGGAVTVDSGNEVFLNLPTSAGTTGSLWNDSGVVKVA